MHFNALDVVVVVLILYSVIQGVVRGMTRQLISLGTLIMGVLVGAWNYPHLAPYLVPYVRNWEIAAFLAFLLIFIAVKLIGVAIGFGLSKILTVADLRWFDRVLGFAFGFAKGFLLSAVLFLGLLAFPFELGWVKNAATAPYLLKGAQWISYITPPEIKTRFHEELEKLRQTWR